MKLDYFEDSGGCSAEASGGWGRLRARRNRQILKRYTRVVPETLQSDLTSSDPQGTPEATEGEVNASAPHAHPLDCLNDAGDARVESGNTLRPGLSRNLGLRNGLNDHHCVFEACESDAEIAFGLNFNRIYLLTSSGIIMMPRLQENPRCTRVILGYMCGLKENIIRSRDTNDLDNISAIKDYPNRLPGQQADARFESRATTSCRAQCLVQLHLEYSGHLPRQCRR